MPDTMTVNDTEYTVLRLLGKGKGGYSYLVTDGEREYVLKQIHHEPCEYYTFATSCSPSCATMKRCALSASPCRGCWPWTKAAGTPSKGIYRGADRCGAA